MSSLDIPIGAAVQKQTSLVGRWLLPVILICFSLGVSLVAVEVALRLMGFSYRLYPEKIEFGWPRPEVIQSLYKPDNDLLWVPKDYDEQLSQLREAPPKLIFMGDSCTQFGKYDQFFSKRLASDFPAAPPQARKLGVGGWSSYQGLQQLKRDIVPLKPKVVTVYFGWNDHWIGFGIQDDMIAKLRSPLFTVLERSRVVQLLVKGYIVLVQGENRFPYRVTLEDFRGNITSIIELARKHDIIPVLLTAPSSHRPGKEPRYLLKRHIKDLRALIPLHESYVEIVREVARATNAPLCDLFQDFRALPQDEVAKRLFTKDGIHLTLEGYETLANFLYECLKRQGIVDRLLE